MGGGKNQVSKKSVCLQLASASSNLPNSNNTFPRLLWASAKSGFNSIALLKLVSASSNLPNSWSVAPKLLQAATLSGFNFKTCL